jgi:hypothetical protein
MSGRLDSNQRPPEPHAVRDVAKTPVNPASADADEPVCTPVCTGEGENARGPDLKALAAELGKLSPADRGRLAALLLQSKEGREAAFDVNPLFLRYHPKNPTNVGAEQ